MDNLDSYCAATKAPVVALLGLMFDIQTDPTKCSAVVRHLDELISAETSRPADIIPASDPWAVHGLRVLQEMRVAALASDAQGVWALFSDKQHGLFLLGNTCQGRAGW
jgi:hypothetical protein